MNWGNILLELLEGAVFGVSFGVTWAVCTFVSKRFKRARPPLV